MNIVFMGTPEFAVPCLQALILNDYNVTAVVTQPDRPKGRGNQLTPPPVKQLALNYNIPVFQPEKIRMDVDFVKTLKDLAPDMIVVVAFGQILPKEVLDIPRFGCINVHGSLLPKYRGAAPIQWSIINGDKITGITTMYMNEGMDTGDMILKEETAISDDETAEELYIRLSNIGAKLLIETVKKIENGTAPRTKQDDTQATKAPMIKKELGNIDWNKSALQIKNLLRGTYPWPGTYTFYKGEKFKIFRVDILDKNVTNAKCGEIVDVTKDSIGVQTGDGIILIKEIQTDNGKRMDVKSYLVGHNIEKNIVLCGDVNGTTC